MKTIQRNWYEVKSYLNLRNIKYYFYYNGIRKVVIEPNKKYKFTSLNSPSDNIRGYDKSTVFIFFDYKDDIRHYNLDFRKILESRNMKYIVRKYDEIQTID